VRRFVLDTNIVVSGYLWGGAPSRLLDAGLAKQFEFVSSDKLIAEFAGAIRRQKFQHAIVRL
jgi:uncharacterized protein